MLFFLESYGDYYLTLVRKSGGDITDQRKAEWIQYETDFEQVGYWVMSAWRFPSSMLKHLYPGDKETPERAILFMANSNTGESTPMDIDDIRLIESLSLSLSLTPPCIDSEFDQWFIETKSHIYRREPL